MRVASRTVNWQGSSVVHALDGSQLIHEIEALEDEADRRASKMGERTLAAVTYRLPR